MSEFNNIAMLELSGGSREEEEDVTRCSIWNEKDSKRFVLDGWRCWRSPEVQPVTGQIYVIFLKNWSDEKNVYYPVDLYNTLFLTIVVP